MGRRSDHTRVELEALFVEEGWRQLAEVGLAQFSARDVAKRIGYSIGSLYNVFQSYDGFLLALNARTLGLWASDLRARLASDETDRIASLVRGYFAFAAEYPRAWIAVYEYRVSDAGGSPGWYQALVADIIGIAAGEIAVAAPNLASAAISPLARSLIATVHGHCVFAQFGTFDLAGETELADAALARVREIIAAARATGQMVRR